ncbi:TIM barrel protein [Chitinophaga sp. MM2321]|uniref:sugar phosphate isomerase/epimerase family protein n=1 Tax=Chitinophaga sp. MM2321 TaxID=3137178 RepID=UPI0032D58A01
MKKQTKKIFRLRCWFLVIPVMTVLFLGGCGASHKTSSSRHDAGSGVQIGTITYSFGKMQGQSIAAVLDYAISAGVNSVELMGGPVEQYAGKPKGNDAKTLRDWRVGISMDKFKEIRKMFDEKGVRITALKLGEKNWSDEEIDYAFNVCRVLGAKGITMEISEEVAQRIAPFANKHNLFIILHNHGQPGKPGFSFDKILAYGPKVMLNLDVGHYYGVTGLHPNTIIERLHDRIVCLHIKDKTGPKAAIPDKPVPFGSGGTPIAEILQLIQQKKWPIICDIEMEYPIPAGSDAVKEVAKCVQYCRAALVANK